LAIRFSPLPEIDTDQESLESTQSNASKKNILQFPHLILGAFAIFLHVGTHIIAIDTIIGYAGSMQIQLLEAKVFPAFTLGATILGYIIGIICIPKFISQVNALRICTVLGLLFSIGILVSHGMVEIAGLKADISIWFVVALGLANSLIWAGIWPLALDGLGKFTKIGASILIMGLCGNAIMPLVYGYFADLYDLKSAYAVLLPCYVYLIFYAVKGHQIKNWKS
jgi:fucose permease